MIRIGSCVEILDDTECRAYKCTAAIVTDIHTNNYISIFIASFKRTVMVPLSAVRLIG